jgi:predicted TIM-barrel fold metal-dependent hydrolase
MTANMSLAELKTAPLGGTGPLIDVHAHFHSDRTGRQDWQQYNASRLEFGDRIGISCHVASVLGSWGHTSPTYFPSPDDLTYANRWLLNLSRASAGRVRAYVAVNPNHPAHARVENQRGLDDGANGIKLAASRRADDVLIDEIAGAARRLGVPVLHHIWQHRRRDWPNQDASDALELGRLAGRHPTVTFILAHIGGGGDWAHSFPAVRDLPNVVMDLSGSGIDRGMLDQAIEGVGVKRLLWAADLTLCTGLTKLRALDVIGLDAEARADIRWRNAVRCFPPGVFSHLPGVA